MIENTLLPFVAKGFWFATAGAFGTMASLFGLHIKNDNAFRKETKETMNTLGERVGQQEVTTAESTTHITYLRDSSDKMNVKLDKLLERKD